MNHQALCALPGLEKLVKNAGLGYATTPIVQLRWKYNKTKPSAPPIGHALSGKQLISRGVAGQLVELLTLEIGSKGTHVCPECSRIAEYNSLIQNLGGFIQHVGSL